LYFWIVQNAASIANDQQELIRLLQEENAALKNQVAHLTFQLEQLKRAVFGSKSERYVPTEIPGQPTLFGVEATAQTPTQEVSYTRTLRQAQGARPVRMEISPNLRRVEEIIEPEHMPEGAKLIGHEITEVLEIIPPDVYVRKIMRAKYAVKESVTVAPMPSLPFPKRNLGASLAAHILVGKFADHLPFYRQRQMLARSGLEVSDSTLGDWFKASADLLSPLYDVLGRKTFEQTYLQGDESPIPVQDNHKAGTTHTGYHWVVHAPEIRAVLFAYHPGRAAKFPDEMLASFSGALQTDGYAGYNNLFAREDITPLACMAHARRKFEHALTNDKARAEHALELIRWLYAIEHTCTEAKMDHEQRRQYRALHAEPILEKIGHWLKEEVMRVEPKSPMGMAIQYALNLWPRLCAYAKDGRYMIDNNLVENTIRPMAIGRKNYMFAGSHKAAQDAALMYSLLGTCKLHGIEPLAYLTDVIARISDHKANKLEELLPWNWKPLAKLAVAEMA
jgi:transposase